MPRHHLAALLLTASLAVPLAGCGAATSREADDSLTIGFAVPVLANPYWRANADFATEIAHQLGAKLIVVDAQEKEDAQLKNVQDLIAQGVDGIVFGPITAEVGPSLLQACDNAGIQCAAMARRPSVEPSADNADHYAGYVVADDRGDGAQAAQALAAAGASRVVAMSGLQGNSVADGRLDGFLEAAKKLHLDVISTHRPVELPKDGLDATQNFLAEHPGPGFDGLYAFNDSSAIGAIEALGDQAGSAVKVASIDGTVEGVRAVEQGQLEMTMGGEFINGGLATVLVYDAIEGNPWEDRGVVLNVFPVTADNVKDYEAQFIDTVPAYDAKQLSRTHNPDASVEDFRIALQ